MGWRDVGCGKEGEKGCLCGLMRNRKQDGADIVFSPGFLCVCLHIFSSDKSVNWLLNLCFTAALVLFGYSHFCSLCDRK